MTDYVFDLTSNDKALKLKLTKAGTETWTDLTVNDSCLAIPSGFVDSSHPDKLICHSGPPDNDAVITLDGASWTSKVRDEGTAVCELCNIGCPNDWDWILSSKN